jgi:UDP-N-acetylglucosamine:LPS N-acetylglucosamine transferase
MMAAGAAILLEQETLSPELLAGTLRSLADQPGELAEMQTRAKARAGAGADESLADLIVKVGGSR